MRKLSLFIVFVTWSYFGIAQDNTDKKFSIEASYPIALTKDYVNNGLIDLGFKYRFVDLKIVKFGAGINASLFIDKNFDNTFATQTKSTNYFIQPKVFAEFTIPKQEKFKPSIGIGYTFDRNKLSGINNGTSVSNTIKSNGMNLNIGASYDITKTIFIQTQYDVSFLKTYPKNFSTLKIGAGFRF